MKTLIEDLESAPTGSRELSDMVLVELGLEKTWVNYASDPPNLRRTAWHLPDGRTRVISPTESLDSALELVGDEYHTKHAYEVHGRDCWWWWLEKGKSVWGGRAKTPVLALCSALLKAKTIDTAESVSVT